jgi:hypothetical protein
MSTNVNLQEENAALRSALEAAKQGINDWLHLYAPDECREDRAAEARKRVHEHGTLAYIAELNRIINEALATRAAEPNTSGLQEAMRPFIETVGTMTAFPDNTGVLVDIRMNAHPRPAFSVGDFGRLVASASPHTHHEGQ